ncbi:GAF domain-containing protein [Shewanella abyssi]|uniref:GAF domain-containing protein n=1 Tax=Shewanella abyssi TaxID=311789 RepID=UPI00200D691D|nr:GAF domain-containing protein [Shewanella abyssi]MCL1048085.1 GAF domain-containing protein [Shewanella abyssi]
MTASFYDTLNRQVTALLTGEDDQVAALANFSALLNDNLVDLNWVGFYLLKNDQLVLGPFQGKVACSRILVGKGVCGTAVETNQTQRIADVHQFAGHIACDSASKSELVVPFRRDGIVIGVLDIDSPSLSRFDEIDQLGVETMVKSLEICLFG